MSVQPKFTAKKAQFLNLKEDGLRQRAQTFRSKRLYTRKGQPRPSTFES